jgi:FAD/FMN-containing dehydrogenase
VGAGARLIDVYAALAAHGRALPAGTCATVGIAGLTMGGGIGVFTRAFGLTCDHLTAATVVTADGATHTVDAQRDADLFWALRGGGGGHAGIVTDFTFGTVPAPNPFTFKIAFPTERTAAVLAAWAAWQTAAPDQLTTTCSIVGGTAPGNDITGTWLGTATGLDDQLSQLIVAVGANPTKREVQQRSYFDAMRYYAGCEAENVNGCHLEPEGTIPREEFRAASRMLSGTLDASDAERVIEVLRAQSEMVLLFDGLGGQVSRVGAADTAFAHRHSSVSVQIYSWNGANGDAVTRVQQELTRVIGAGTYVNYVNPQQTDWATSYWGANLRRLRRTVTAYDPNRVFDFPHSVLRA